MKLRMHWEWGNIHKNDDVPNKSEIGKESEDKHEEGNATADQEAEMVDCKEADSSKLE